VVGRNIYARLLLAMSYQYGPEVASKAVRERHRDAKIGGWIGRQGGFFSNLKNNSGFVLVISTFS